MSKNDFLEENWDVNSSLRFLQSLIQLIQKGKNSEMSFKKLRTVCECFYRRSIERDYCSKLDSTGISLLETQIEDLASLVCSLETLADQHKSHRTVPLKICLLMITSYITCKTNRVGNISYISNAMKLAIETAINCYNEEQWQGMHFCLNMANFYDGVYFHWSQVARLEPEFRSTNIFNIQFHLVAQVLWLYALGNHYEISRMLSREKTSSVDLSVAQKETISSVCFNIGLQYFKKELYEEAAIWLKYSYTFGPSLKETSDYRSGKTVSLVLLAACYFRLNASEYSDRITFLLNRSGNKATVKELVVSTLLVTKSRDSVILSATLDYLASALNKSVRHFHKGIEMVFTALANNQRLAVIGDLLNQIPWNMSSKIHSSNYFQRFDSEVLSDLRWICARVATQCYLNNRSLTSCYNLLVDMAQWEPRQNKEDIGALQEILALAESHAMHLYEENQYKKAIDWYSVIAKVLERHAHSIPSVLSNGIRCCLQMDELSNGVSNSLQFFLKCGLKVDADCQLLCWKLLIAILIEDHLAATEISLQLDDIHKDDVKNAESKCDDWAVALEILEKSILLASKKNMADVVIHSLNAVMHECNRIAAFQPNAYACAIRIHLTVLFRVGGLTEIIETKCTDNVIAALISSYLELKDSIEVKCDNKSEANCGSTEESDASSEIELQYANTAWDLGHILTSSSPFHRHQLFKLSYKLYSLCHQVPQVKEHTVISALLSVAAAINTKSCEHHQPYAEILTRSLSVIEEFLTKFPQSAHVNLIRLYEFYILCELGHLERVEDIVQMYLADSTLGDKSAVFFEGVAALASPWHEVFLLQILPPAEAQQFRIENHRQRPIHWQLKLTPMAIQCLKAANSILNSQGSPSLLSRISENWFKITTMAYECAFLQKALRDDYFSYCLEYANFLSLNVHHITPTLVAPFLAQVWNTFIRLSIYHMEGKTEAARWFQLSHKLLALFPELQLPNEGHINIVF